LIINEVIVQNINNVTFPSKRRIVYHIITYHISRTYVDPSNLIEFMLNAMYCRIKILTQEMHLCKRKLHYFL